MSNNQKNSLINGGYPLHTFEDLQDLIFEYISSAEDCKRIKEAYDFMMIHHKGQYRKSGEEYYHHLIEVAYILASLKCGPSTIIAGLLHDIVEDTDVTNAEIENIFGKDVAKLVESLTKISALQLSKIKSQDFAAEDHRKILIGMAKDVRVIIIKLADRLHNMRTLSSLSLERQLSLSQETLDVFVPIASRLGFDTLKSELSDISLKYLEPEKYQEIKKLLANKTKVLQKALNGIKKRIADVLFEHNISFDISARVKSIYSIYGKMYKKNHSFDQIYDILALRVIVKTEIECYEVLGLIHQMYKPVPGRFKDYIAMPKTNMYQSLHTTIISGDGNFYEVQIRTEEMDKVAEYGVAAHWAYKEGTGYNPKTEQKEIEDKLHWFRDFVSITSEHKDESANEYMDNLTHDIFEANVYVFTPLGKVVELPTGSTPVDFAYRVHTRVGDTCVGAVVNGVMLPLNTVLKSGDVVEVKTNKNSSPNEGWLDFVVTSQAKSHIKKAIAKKNADILREERIQKGKQSCIDAFADRKINEQEMMDLLNNKQLLDNYNAQTVDDLFVMVFSRNPTANAIIDYLKIKKPVEIPTEINPFLKKTNNKGHLYVKGGEGIAISLASCCSPIPGDDIIGYITKGKGITVHRLNCPNVAGEKERLIDVYWRDDIEFASYVVDLNIEANDRPNLLTDVMNVLSANKVPVNNIHARYIKNNSTVLISTSIVVSDVHRLNYVISLINSINNVISTIRVIH